MGAHLTDDSRSALRALVVTAGTHVCAIPVLDVSETMRPLPIEPLAATSRFVLGLSVIRGAPVPVVDLWALLDDSAGAGGHGRFVTLKVAARRVALAVGSVLGLRTLRRSQLEGMPPLLRDTSSQTVEAIGATDGQLLVVLRGARLVPEEVWDALASVGRT